jgi:2'-5' RNA ligase
VSVRLFVAVSPPEDARTHLAAALPSLQIGGRPVRPGRWHLTLAFLEDVPDDRVPEVRAAVDGAAGTTGPFSVRLTGAGAFGQVVWIGLSGETDPLVRLAGELRRRLRDAGFPVEERPFRPHLTIARGVDTRRPSTAAALASLAEYDGPPWTVRQLVLVHSTLGPGGARHEPIGAAALQPV